MKEKKLMVEKMPKCYVGKDCIQIMIPFTKSVRIFENDVWTLEDVKCRYFVNGSHSAINTYLSDERRNNFPYSNIPLHCSRVGDKKVYYVNQLFNFDTDYWCLIDEEVCYAGYLVHYYLVRDNNDVLLVSQYYSMNIYNKYNSIQGDLPRRKYTLEEIKGLTPVKIKKISRYPKISFGLNPNISMEEVRKNRRLVRTLNNK